MKMVNLHEAKTHFFRLLDRAHAGEEIVIGKAGKPYAKLVPLTSPTARVSGITKGSVTEAFFEPLPEDELQAWES
jgi:prevent-host-death family protein